MTSITMTTKEAGVVLGVYHRHAQRIMDNAKLTPIHEANKGTRRKYLWYTVEVMQVANGREPGRFVISQADIDAAEADKRQRAAGGDADMAARRAKLRGAIKELGYE